MKRTSGSPVRAGKPLADEIFGAVRRRAVLEGCKWDPQVGDVSTLANFPLLVRRSVWTELALLAEQLAAETTRAEVEILSRPVLLKELGFPHALCRVLRHAAEPTPAAVRVLRFDFHFTSQGWRISEVNSDVPGGFTEASFFTRLMAEHYSDASLPGTPVVAWADALTRAAGAGGTIALLTAPGFMEDHQVVAYLAGYLRARECRACLANPSQFRWHGGIAHLETDYFRGRIGAIVRFYQGEWLSELRRYGWQNFFRGGLTPVGNPGIALISESKRLPLLWDRLATPLPTWRRLLPESRDPRQVPWQTDDGWLVKSAMSNTGDDVCIREFMRKAEWRHARWAVRLSPNRWVAQRRFESVAVETPRGPMHACLGVYTIDGRVAGAYARLAPRPLIDFAAVDAALLIEDDD